MKFGKKIPQFLIIFFVCLSLVSSAFFGSLLLKEQGFSVFQGFSQKNPFSKSSQAKLSLDGNNLKINFDVIEEDKQRFATVLRSLELDRNIEQGISIGLDSKSSEKIKNNFPVSVDLKFEEKGIKFSNNILPVLKSSQVGEAKEYASGSGKLSYKTDGSDSLYLTVKDPGEFIKNATSSRVIYLSENSQSLFKVLSKLATIEISVNGKNI